MEDFLDILKKVENFDKELEDMQNDFMHKLKVQLWGTSVVQPFASIKEEVPASPQQKTKRPKRLASLREDIEENSLRSSVQGKNLESNITESELTVRANGDGESVQEEHFVRPQRAAKLKSIKNLKEPQLRSKLRRPSDLTVQVKLEEHQRKSQASSTDSSVVVIPEKQSIVEINSDEEVEKPKQEPRSLRVKIKREKMSMGEIIQMNSQIETTSASDFLPEKLNNVQVSSQISTLDNNTTAMNSSTKSTKGKKNKEKKDCFRPIKVERWSNELPDTAQESENNGVKNVVSDPDNGDKMPIPEALASESDADAHEKSNRLAHIQNKSLESIAKAPSQDDKYKAETDTTFIVPSQVASNATFVTESVKDCSEQNGNHRELELEEEDNTEVSCPQLQSEGNLLKLTETNSERNMPEPSSIPLKVPVPVSTFKMPTRTNELFNPLIQSPVKMKVKAFENASTVAEPKRLLRSKHTKENHTPKLNVIKTFGSNNLTPSFVKPQPSVVGRFLTPTQASNAPISVIQAKKGPNSASKAISSLKPTSATKTAANFMQKENKMDTLKKDINQLSEDERKRREQKHVAAAQYRETKERERAERILKLQKEREEKRLKKHLESQKKRELEEIQRKKQDEMRSNSEFHKQIYAAKVKPIEKSASAIVKPQPVASARSRMMEPPVAKSRSKYTFEMLHADDSTDDESKTSHKRPEPPLWSQRSARGPIINIQQYWPTEVIDSFFSVQPMTPDLQIIFPGIDVRHLRRNSSVLWSTPPRYSELPKY